MASAGHVTQHTRHINETQIAVRTDTDLLSVSEHTVQKQTHEHQLVTAYITPTRCTLTSDEGRYTGLDPTHDSRYGALCTSRISARLQHLGSQHN